MSDRSSGHNQADARHREERDEMPATETIEVFVEIPRGSRNKYEYDHERHVIRLDRRLFSATVYPADYGFIPDTLGEDGDPLDALVLNADPTFPGCVVTARPLAVFWMSDEKGPDAKIICAPQPDPDLDRAQDLGDLPAHMLEEIKHFFSVYKDLEPGKASSTRDYEGRDAAWAEIRAAQERHRSTAG
jgi:inorganic pyrophosphatase